MKKLFSHPLFLVGLIVRLTLVAFVIPEASNKWYSPFLDVTTAQITIDPWWQYLSQGGVVEAFPYGYAMWLAFLPLTLLCKLLGTPVIYGYGLTLVAVDVGLLIVLGLMLPSRPRLLLVTYWLSPIVLIGTYWLGLNDLVPVLLLTLALYFTRQLQLARAGLLCAAAVSAKLSMVLAVPFFFLYLLRNRAFRQLLPQYLKGLVAGSIVLLLPFAFSSAGLNMLLNNPEMGKVYQFALEVSNGASIYVLPMAYIVMLYAAWRVCRINFELFNAMLGIAFLLVILLTPASPGWFIWIVPLFVFYQAMSGRTAIILVGAFSVLYVLNNVLAMPLPLLAQASDSGFHGMQLRDYLSRNIISLFQTAMTTVGVILTIRVWRESVSFNDYFRLSRKPFVIGIAGDSGAGKDTLADSLQGLFGTHSVVTLSGDDYHLWDRHKPMWQMMTHLNPMANDLEAFLKDLVALIGGKSIHARHYDHETGKMSGLQRIKSNDFIIASGLHALYLPILRECYNLSIYLDIDERLRRYYKLRRDVHQRGHSAERVLSSLERREPDSVRFVRPQGLHADLIMSLQPIHPHLLDGHVGVDAPSVKLFIRSRNGLSERSLIRVLVGVCGLHVDRAVDNDANEVALTIEGETAPEDISLAASMLFPRVLEFLDIAPQWRSGPLGLMQLITLAHINQALNKRLIW